jgi:hypothetical protein
MVESKSGYFAKDFNAHSEKCSGSNPRCIKRLGANSEWD